MPVIVCGSFVYPGMKTYLPVDTRQMKDLIHIVTSTRDSQISRKFIIVREYSDMRGFRMGVRQVTRENNDRQVIVEVLGEARVRIESIFIPDERRGLYQDEAQALKFASGAIIHDENPYKTVVQATK